jgi:hypothetical protein
MKRTWKFRTKILVEVSKECKIAVKFLLEPDTRERWNIDQYLYSDWIVKDPKLRGNQKKYSDYYGKLIPSYFKL